MITLDKIKIVSHIDNFQIVDKDKFDVISKEDSIVSCKFTQTTPYLLYIEANRKNRELIVEFSGKILKDNYPDLINKSNIKDCFQAINLLEICRLDIDGIMRDGQVVKADITKDVDYPCCEELSKSIQANIVNFRKYRSRTVNGNFVIEKNVTTKSCKSRLTLYDKAKEMNRAENRPFLATLSDKRRLLNHFDNKVRFEMNLNSKEQIRRALHVHNLSIMEVLNTEANPILDFLNKVIPEAESCIAYNDLREFMRGAVLQICDNDIEKVEAKLRQVCSPKTHINQVIKPFRMLLNRINDTPAANIRTTLQSLLLEITILLMVTI